MTADTVGGVWTYALDLARGLAEHGVSATLATMGALPSEEQRLQAASVPGLDLRANRYRLEWMDDPWADVDEAGAWLLAIEGETAPDVVHLNGFAHGHLAFRAPVLVAGHSCVLSWWEAVRGEPAPESWNEYRARVRRGLQAAKSVIAPTATMLAALQRHYGPLRSGRVVPNGRDATALRPADKEAVVLTAGRFWDEAKNLRALATAAPDLPWPVLAAGFAEHPQGHATDTGGLRFLGALTQGELAAWMGRAAIYALPARYEPFGLSALEAALSGCALVLGDIPSLREVWGDAARFVPPNDTAALRAALLELIANQGERESLAARARERASAYSLERMTTATLAVYSDLLAGPGGYPSAKEAIACAS